jgi:cytochrome c biogenesis protein CcmG/thiol:disulfide interchange protein DsbE
MRRPILLLSALLLLAAAAGAPPVAAEGAYLNDLVAPELTFPTGLNGVTKGQTLSSFRGKVVWLKFWLRDCPRCRKTLPRAQELHELYGKSGLVVLTVVHQYGPDQVKPFLDKEGYTFPVACDPTGALAQAYQVNHRPTDYVIGVNGRVLVSNAGPDDVLEKQLELHRVGELGRVPPALEGVKEEVRGDRYGPALSKALALAGAADAAPEVREFAARLQGLAEHHLGAQIDRAHALARRERMDEARSLLEGLATGFEGTPFAERAREAWDAFRAAQPR